jgi:hypothetical protein
MFKKRKTLTKYVSNLTFKVVVSIESEFSKQAENTENDTFYDVDASMIDESCLISIENNATIKFQLDSFRYPFYLLNRKENSEILSEFKEIISKKFNGILSLNEKILEIEIKNSIDQYSEEVIKSNFVSFIEAYTSQYFTRFDLTEFNDSASFIKKRNKAIELFAASTDINLIYRNHPEPFIRIEGSKTIMDKELIKFKLFL